MKTYLVGKTLLLQVKASGLSESSPLGGSGKDRCPGRKSPLHYGKKGDRMTGEKRRIDDEMDNLCPIKPPRARAGADREEKTKNRGMKWR
jgi:hypothetical protein